MQHRRILGLLATAAALTAFGGTASATSVSTTTGGTAETPDIHLESEGHVTLANPIATRECNLTYVLGVTQHDGPIVLVSHIKEKREYNCTNGWTVIVNAPGSLSINYTSGHSGTVSETGSTWTVIRHTIFGTVECRYSTNNTHIGTLTGGNPATLELEGSIPFHGGSALCGEGTSQMSGSLVTTSTLYVAP